MKKRAISLLLVLVTLLTLAVPVYAADKPATPKITNVSGTAGDVTITWGAVSGAAKYRLFYLSGGKWKSLGDTTATSMVCPKAKAGTTYVFTVRCVNADGKSYTSNYDRTGTTYTVPKNTITWSLKDGVLTISGYGPMEDYIYGGAPWYEDRASITNIIIEEGVTTIGQCALYGCSNAAKVTIPGSVTTIGDGFCILQCIDGYQCFQRQ